MGLKDELQKIVSAERQKIDDREDAQRFYWSEQKKRFVVLAKLLRELSDELDPRHGEIKVREDRARIRLGRKKEGDNSSFRLNDIRIEIEPDFSANFRTGAITNERGFRLEQTEIYSDPEREMSETVKNFPTEEAVMEYLLSEIGEKIAHYQHLDELAAK